MTVSLRQKISAKQSPSPIIPKKEEEKTTDPPKTPDDPVVTDGGDQARETKTPGRDQAQTCDVAGGSQAPKVEAQTNDLILNIRSEVNS
jgi:hypothetical protein